jgi:hypothetical protein
MPLPSLKGGHQSSLWACSLGSVFGSLNDDTAPSDLMLAAECRGPCISYPFKLNLLNNTMLPLFNLVGPLSSPKVSRSLFGCLFLIPISDELFWLFYSLRLISIVATLALSLPLPIKDDESLFLTLTILPIEGHCTPYGQGSTPNPNVWVYVCVCGGGLDFSNPFRPEAGMVEKRAAGLPQWRCLSSFTKREVIKALALAFSG